MSGMTRQRSRDCDKKSDDPDAGAPGTTFRFSVRRRGATWRIGGEVESVGGLPMANGSITGWIDRLKAGDWAAASPLWETYFVRLVAFARERLRGASRRVADEEDAALSAFDSFCSAAVRGRFPQLANRRSLWPLLAALTRHKCVDQVRRESRRKRGGNHGREDAI